MTSRPPHTISVRVYYEDTDLAGVVYYANYLRFYERGRSEALRDLGIDQVAMKAAGLVFVVRSFALDYLVPARFDDLLEIRTGIGALRGASLEMTQEVLRDGETLNRATARIACMTVEGRPARLPADLRAALAPERG
ncbi:acyl-CoA thioester hydrolase [Albimonas donghaensis]|uniref:Acyl-CoA thioester hydrolase n=1 Tax=Albimonas donghaensis TaxID=356660 RepID=A0A1H2W726_9RHOB|nr:tol-pal system-associated acyl-CoA thioesterase [Albimonas donghaensis]SDW76236.1 acyl-CoA thioester hydrolase [Albimonas donghaensis]